MTDTTTDITIVRKKVTDLVTELDSLSVTNNDEAAVAGDFLTRLKTTQKMVADHYEPERKRTYEVYKAVVAERDKLAKPLEQAERSVKKLIGAWRTEQERKRREAEEAARREMERKRREEEDRRLAEAEATGKEELLEKPVIVAQDAPAAPEPQKLDGISYSERWLWDIEDESRLPREFLMADARAIDMAVRRNKGETSIPGVRVYAEKIVRAGRR